MQVARDELEAAKMVLECSRWRCVELGMRRHSGVLDGEAPVAGKIERRHGVAASEGEGSAGAGGAPGGGIRRREEEAGGRKKGRGPAARKRMGRRRRGAPSTGTR
jgi:hypothetical protein